MLKIRWATILEQLPPEAPSQNSILFTKCIIGFNKQEFQAYA